MTSHKQSAHWVSTFLIFKERGKQAARVLMCLPGTRKALGLLSRTTKGKKSTILLLLLLFRGGLVCLFVHLFVLLRVEGQHFPDRSLLEHPLRGRNSLSAAP